MSVRLVRAAAIAAVVLTACGNGDPVDSAEAPASTDQVETTSLAEESTTAPPTTAQTTSSSDEATSSTTATTASEATTPTTTTTTAPETSTTTSTAVPADLVELVGGGQLDLNSIQGTDTVLWFWAPW